MFKKLKALFSGRANQGLETNPFIDGQAGLVWETPASWDLQETWAQGCRWQPPEGGAVILEYLGVPLDLSVDLLDVFRQDLRLAARRNFGGLVECDLLNTPAIAGIEKFANRDSENGMVYSAHALIPAIQQGCLYLRILAAEGGMTGIRESLVTALERRDGSEETEASLNTWFQDPYEPSICGAPAIFSAETGEPPADMPGLKNFAEFFAGEDRTGPLEQRMVLRARSDDAQFDEVHPDHPLSMIRRILADFRANAHCTADRFSAPRELIDQERGFRADLPGGFFAAPEMSMAGGQGYRRSTFDHRVNVITLCLQPEFPDCGRSVEGALAIQKQHAEWSGMQWKAAPLIRPETMGQHSGMYYEARGLLQESDMLWMGMYIPWGDISMEITVGAEPDDRKRNAANLRLVMESLQSLRSP